MAATAAVTAATKAEEAADAAEAGHLLLGDVDFLIDGGTSSFLVDSGTSGFLVDGGAAGKRKAPCSSPCLSRKRRVTAGRCLDVVLRASDHGGGAAQRTGGQQPATASSSRGRRLRLHTKPLCGGWGSAFAWAHLKTQNGGSTATP